MTLLKTNNNITNQPKKLSVQISLTGLSFLVFNEHSQNTSYFTSTFSEKLPPEAVLEEIKKQLAQREITLQEDAEITLIYTIPLSSLVPLPLFDETKKSEYLKFNSKILATDYIAHDELASQSMAIVYIPYVNINNYFVENCGNVTYYHSNTLLINKLVNSTNKKFSDAFFMFVQEQQVDVFVMKENTLQLANSFQFQTAEDFIYYILFVMEQLQLNPDAITTFVCGAIIEESELFEIAYQYIRNIDVLPFTEWGGKVTDDPTSILHHLV